jgi:hypothetical protein
MAERDQVVVELDREAIDAAKSAGLGLSTVLLATDRTRSFRSRAAPIA